MCAHTSVVNRRLTVLIGLEFQKCSTHDPQTCVCVCTYKAAVYRLFGPAATSSPKKNKRGRRRSVEDIWFRTSDGFSCICYKYNATIKPFPPLLPSNTRFIYYGILFFVLFSVWFRTAHVFFFFTLINDLTSSACHIKSSRPRVSATSTGNHKQTLNTN